MRDGWSTGYTRHQKSILWTKTRSVKYFRSRYKGKILIMGTQKNVIHLKRNFQTINSKSSTVNIIKDLFTLDTLELRLPTGLLTGYCLLGYHPKKMGTTQTWHVSILQIWKRDYGTCIFLLYESETTTVVKELRVYISRNDESGSTSHVSHWDWIENSTWLFTIDQIGYNNWRLSSYCIF